jgi:hypothetical protein
VAFPFCRRRKVAASSSADLSLRVSQAKAPTMAELDEIELTAADAFRALGHFVRDYTNRGSHDRAVVLLWSYVGLEPDGEPLDPAAKADWLKSVEEVLDDRSCGPGGDRADI